MSSETNPQSTSSPEALSSVFSPLVKTLALIPSLMIAGSMTAQTAEPAAPAQPEGAPVDAQATPTDAVELPKVEVQTQKQNQISSPKFTAPLVDTPQTVVVIPREVYAAQGATSLSEVLRNTPGITFAAGEGGNASGTAGDAFFMRGYDASNNIFIDGFRDTGAVTRDVFNVEQVEIAKGPSGENGRGATSGYINLVTKSPRLETFFTSTVSYSFDDTDADGSKRASFDFNQSLDSKLPGSAFRLNALVQDGGVIGRQYAEQNRWSIAPSLAFGLGTPTRLILSYQRTEQDNIPDYGVPAAISSLVNNQFHVGGIDQSNFYGLVDYDFENVETDAFSARIEHDFTPDLKLVNQTRVSRNHREAEITSVSVNAGSAALGQGTRSRARNDRVTRNVANQTAFNANFLTGLLDHALSAGLEVSHETADSPTWTGLGTAPNADLDDPDVHATIPGYNPVRSGVRTDAYTDTVAVFAFDTIKFNKYLQATGGLRAEAYKSVYKSISATNVVTEPDHGYATWKNPLVSWKGGLVFKPATNGSIYGSYNKSIRPAGTNFSTSTAATNADNANLDPQETHNYELGTKWDFFQGRLSTTAALFRSINTNIAVTDPTDPSAVIQTQDQTIEGIELGVSGKITDAWLVFAGYSYMDSKVSSIISTNTQGLTLPLLPTHSGNIWTTYRLPFGLTIGGGAQYQGDSKRLQAPITVTPTTNDPTIPAYWVFNAIASYEFTKQFTLRLNVNNVFDKDYATSYNNNGNRINLGAPRNFIISADFKF